MITCIYCGYECPDNAHICPNCGKPIIKESMHKQPTFDDIKESLRREKAGVKQEEPRSQTPLIMAACVVLLIALAIYKYL
ncbi:zinc ribbon domain-containing protein [Sporomusa sp.]|uniref:zinc ribbon domain-containing protein n=1 Tax=Sporomusa sp. TaxID=2078658 RepID=UPI002CE7848D|nr:zinc ribbon domain-containing protein [Sporomusa sp.]HWR43564.1 zinc ribbon domain-containing protein [Sporomusa sp.]